MPIVTTDPIADMLTRIRNAIAVRKSEVVMPHSKLKEAIARLLAKNSFIDSVSVHEGEVGKLMKLTLHPVNSNAKISEIVRMSSPGRRWYAKADNIPVIRRGRGIVVVSTSQGLMTGSDAKSKGLGGELICKVY